MFDSSELTLDLVHILELIDNPENLSKVKSVCQGLLAKLDRCEAEYLKLIEENSSLFEEGVVERLEAKEQKLNDILKKKEEFKQLLTLQLQKFNTF